MAKLNAPLFSFEARGRLSKALSFRRRGSATIAEKKPDFPDQKTPAQLNQRLMYQQCLILWNLQSATAKKEWTSLARPKHMPGLALFMNYCLKPNPGVYLPLAGGTMTGDIAMATHKITDLPQPTLDQDSATKKYVDDAPGADYPMKLNPALVRWVIPGWYFHANANAAITANLIYYIPVFVSEPTTYIRIGCYVGVGSAGTADLRIFAWSNGLPASLILSAGTVNTTGAGYKEIIIAQQLTRGYYFLAIRCTATPQIRGIKPDTNPSAPCLPGFSLLGIPAGDNLILTVSAAYADPAPAPTGSVGIGNCVVLLREN